MDDESALKRVRHGRSHLTNNWRQQNLNSDLLPTFFFILHKNNKSVISALFLVWVSKDSLGMWFPRDWRNQTQMTSICTMCLTLQFPFCFLLLPKEPRQSLVLVSSLCVRVRSALGYTGDIYLWHVIAVPSECQSVLYRSISSDCLCCPDWGNLFDFIFLYFLSSSWVYKLPEGACSNVYLLISVSLAPDT